MRLDDYTRRHPHILSRSLPPLLADHVKDRRLGRVVDLGAGDGQALWALRGRFTAATAVDLAEGRIEHLRAVLPEVTGVVGDACATGLDTGSADSVLCSQVIEHVPDEHALAAEIHRLLRPDGWFYIGSVLRARRAFWPYRHDGQWWLDPTHVREYRSPRQLTDVLQATGLHVAEVRVSPFRFPVTDLLLRAAVALRLVSATRISRFYAGAASWKLRLRRLRIQPPGYFVLEVVGRRSAHEGAAISS
jgi:SAM-dependent methyltransferase